MSQMGDIIEGWTSAERRVAVEVADLLGWKPEQALTSVVMAPLFAGVAGDIVIEFDHAVDVDAVVLCSIKHLAYEWGTRSLDPDAWRETAPSMWGAFGPIQILPGLHLWFTADNLRVGASANALAIATALWSEGYV